MIACLIALNLYSLVFATAASSKKSVAVYFDTQTKSFSLSSEDSNDEPRATGSYYVNYNESGWNYLDAVMKPKTFTREDRMINSKALGYLEGYVTCEEIKTFWPNFYSGLFGTSRPGEKTLAFLRENYAWMNLQAVQYASTDDYWFTVKTILEQLNGLFEGYTAGCTSTTNTPSPNDVEVTNPWATLDNPTLEHFLMINAWGDLYQITMKYLEPGHDSRRRGNKRTGKDASDFKIVERCSAIVKLLPGLEDVVFGHTTWDTYESMAPRIIKRYRLPLNRDAGREYDVYFSSSPALLSSVDDFYIANGDASLGVMETTNSLFNLDLLDLVVPQLTLSWMRVIVSNQLAQSGSNWPEIFVRYHSGTYTNQWMVLDLNLFTPGVAPDSGFFTVFEEVPGLVHYEDQTDFLNENTYWPSFNNPFYDDIFEASGYASVCRVDEDYCHESAPRNTLFAENHENVVNVLTGGYLLNYNKWQVDTASKNDSCNAVACRGDLELRKVSRGAYGGLDGKVASAVAAKRGIHSPPQFYARLGPTKDDQEVFCWSQFAEESDYSHLGSPDCFDYDWQLFPPSLVE